MSNVIEFEIETVNHNKTSPEDLCHEINSSFKTLFSTAQEICMAHNVLKLLYFKGKTIIIDSTINSLLKTFCPHSLSESRYVLRFETKFLTFFGSGKFNHNSYVQCLQTMQLVCIHCST